MTAARRFSEATLEELANAKILGVRAGAEHRYTGVWVVVVEGRVFVRSWNDKPTGDVTDARSERPQERLHHDPKTLHQPPAQRVQCGAAGRAEAALPAFPALLRARAEP